MIEYQNLKLEYKTFYKNSTSTNNLATLLKEYYLNSKKENILLIKNTIKNTNNPIQFYKILLNKQ